jgi:hypothetical protein
MTDTKLSKVFLSGRLSSTVIIPIQMARKHGLDKFAYVTFEDSDEGILIKKVEI